MVVSETRYASVTAVINVLLPAKIYHRLDGKMDSTIDEIINDVTAALFAHNETAIHDDSSAADHAVDVLPVFTGRFPVFFAAVSASFTPTGGLATAAAAA